MDKSSYELFNDPAFKEKFAEIPQPIIIADHIRTPENMGAILRLAGNIGAIKTLFISDVAADFKNYKINKTASGAASKVDWKIVAACDIQSEIPKDYKVVALETTTVATTIFAYTFPKKVAFILGNEVTGINHEILKITHDTVYIPIPGNISSLNVTHALSVALFEWLRQMSS